MLALLIAIGGGTVLATVAGARRTTTAFTRLVDVTHPADAVVAVSHETSDELIDAIARDPRVTRSSVGLALAALPADHPELYLPIGASIDGRWGGVIDVPRLVAGRRARPEAPDEVTLTERRAHAMKVGVGDTFRLGSFSAEQIDRSRAGENIYSETPAGPTVRMHVVGIERGPASLATGNDLGEVTILTPAFLREYGDAVGSYGRFVEVQLRRQPHALERFATAVHRIPGLERAQVDASTPDQGGVADTSRFVATGLTLFAIAAAAAAAVAIGQAMARQAVADATELESLTALGLTRRQRAASSALSMAPSIVMGTAAAVVLAVIGSTPFPFGVAGRAEPDRGVRIDGLVLGAGFVGLFLVLGTLAAATAAYAHRRTRPVARSRSNAVVRWLTRAGAAPSRITGVRFALEGGRGPRSVPARTALTAAVTGFAGVVAVLTFGASLDRIITTPSAFGRTWDLTASSDGHVRELLADRDVTGLADVRIGGIEINGQPARARGLRTFRGPAPITIIRGRAPANGRETALGAKTMKRIGARLGDAVALRGSDGHGRFRVVGEALFAGLDDTPELADAVAVTEDAFDSLIDREQGDAFTMRVVRLRPGADRRAAVRRLRVYFPDADSPLRVDRVTPIEVAKLDEARALPLALATFLGLLAFAALGHALAATARRRRVDLAILRTLGFRPRDVRRTVTAEALTIALTGVLAGIPAGIAIGRLAWRPVARGLGVADVPVIPGGAVAVAMLAALAAAVLLSVPSGVAASHVEPARALHTQ